MVLKLDVEGAEYAVQHDTILYRDMHDTAGVRAQGDTATPCWKYRPSHTRRGPQGLKFAGTKCSASLA